MEPLSTLALADRVLPVMSQLGRGNGDGSESEGWVVTKDNSGLRVVCYIDHDYVDYALVEMRRPFLYRTRDVEGPTRVDHLFVHRHPDGVSLRRHNRPHDIFDETVDRFAAYREFLAWVEACSDGQ